MIPVKFPRRDFYQTFKDVYNPKLVRTHRLQVNWPAQGPRDQVATWVFGLRFHALRRAMMLLGMNVSPCSKEWSIFPWCYRPFNILIVKVTSILNGFSKTIDWHSFLRAFDTLPALLGVKQSPCVFVGEEHDKAPEETPVAFLWSSRGSRNVCHSWEDRQPWIAGHRPVPWKWPWWLTAAGAWCSVAKQPLHLHTPAWPGVRAFPINWEVQHVEPQCWWALTVCQARLPGTERHGDSIDFSRSFCHILLNSGSGN